MPTPAEAIAEVNRVYREFNRYSGDGKPGEPLNAPLPIGDPQSGVANPKKAELRAMLIAVLLAAGMAIGEAEAAVDKAEAAAALAEAAADAALAAVTGIIAPKATVADAIADDPAVDPAYYDIAYFDTAYQTGSGAKWKKVASNPGLVSGAAFQNANGTWYVNDAQFLKPQQFGAVGSGAAADTAAWARMASVATARGGRVEVMPTGSFRLNGNAITFQGIDTVIFHLCGMSQAQQQALSRTIRCDNCRVVRWIGGDHVGYAAKQIAETGTTTEVNWDGGSYNGVAALYCYNCDEVYVDDARFSAHAGGSVTSFGHKIFKATGNTVIGVGPRYNRPIADNHQGNGSDSGFYTLPSDTTKGWSQEDFFENNIILWHSFGIRSVMNKTLVVHDNEFPFTPGQHHVYATEADGVRVTDNKFVYCRQIAFKNQLENYAGTIGKVYPAWQPSTAYVVGDRRVAFSAAYRCKTAHTSGGSFTGTEWEIAPEYRRRGGLIEGNRFDGCGQGVGLIAASPADGLNIWYEDYLITCNNFLNGISENIYVERCMNAVIDGNKISGGLVGIFAKFFSGSIAQNKIRRTERQAISASIAKATFIDFNVFTGCGYLGANDTDKSIVLVFAPASTSIEPPDREANPVVPFRGNGYLEIESFSGGYLLFDSDARLAMQITDTQGSPTAKLMRVEGTLAYKSRNHFPGYVNPAQNEATWTIVATTDYDLNSATDTTSGVGNVLGTLINTLKAKRLI